MKVLVTGATGFIGNYVIKELLKRKCLVIASSLHTEKAENAEWFDQVEYIPFDLAEMNEQVDYFNLFNNPDVMIHLAWEGLPNYKSDFHEKINGPRHYSFLQNLIRHGLKDLTVTGTCLEYGMKEGSLNESMPAEPANSYALAKNKLRIELGQLQNEFPFSFKWIRLFYMYGKGQNPKSLFSQLDAALTANEEIFNMSGGEQVRDYLPVEKMTANIVAIALQKEVTGVINNCSGIPVRITDLVKDYLESRKKQIKLNPGYYPYPDYEPMRFWGDVNKLNLIINRL